MSDYDRSDIHWSGQIWSRALHDINTQLGADDATRLIVEAQFAFAPGTSFEAAAQRTVETAKLLFPKRPSGREGVRQAFVRPRQVLDERHLHRPGDSRVAEVAPSITTIRPPCDAVHRDVEAHLVDWRCRLCEATGC
jgi:hypothetical protein